MLLEVYIATVLIANALDFSRSPYDYVRVLHKNRALLPTTLFHMLITNIVATCCSDRFLLPDLHDHDDVLTELLRFFMMLHAVEAWTFATHYGMHCLWYTPHKKHHKVIEPSVLFTYHNGIIDTIIASAPFYVFPYLFNISKLSLTVFVMYNIFMGSYAHRMPVINGVTKYSFHNYHHAAFIYNFGTGYPGTFHIWDRLVGTYKNPTFA